MTKTTKRNLWILVGVLLVGGLVAWTISKNADRKEGTAVEFGTVEKATIEERVSASGRIFPVTDVGISSDVSGEVVELFVREGDSVRAGQLLARIDADAYESQVARGQAQVNSAQALVSTAQASIEQLTGERKRLVAQLEANQLALRRAEQLAKEGLLSQAELENAQVAVALFKAQVEAADANLRGARETVKGNSYAVASARATLRELQTSLRRTNIVAPMDGILSQLNVEEGERVVGTMQMAGTELARVADLTQMEVRVEVSENDIPRVSLGDPVDIEVDAYLDRKFTGKVAEISSSANNLTSAAGVQTLNTDQVTNFTVTILIDASSYADLVAAGRAYPFRPGMSASVEILTETVTDAVSVPIAAVTARETDEKAAKAQAGDESDGASATATAASETPATEDLVEVVWVVKDDGTVERRVVKTGVQNRKVIQVTSGLRVGERIVVGPYAQVARKLKDGSKVYEEEDDADDEPTDDDA